MDKQSKDKGQFFILYLINDRIYRYSCMSGESADNH